MSKAMIKLFRIDKNARVKAPASDFVGEVYRQRLTEFERENIILSNQFIVSVVTFYDGAHNVPHVHEGDHMIIITEGEGLVATDTEEYKLTAGDVAFIPGGVRHCHGSQPGHSMTQIAILAGNK